MPSPATLRERRLRKTKAQLIDEIDSLERRAPAIEAAHGSGAPLQTKASERYLANQQIAHLARFTSENPNPVLRVMPDGTVLYANEAARAVKGLLEGGKKSTLARDLTSVVAEASRTAQVRETEFESGDRVFAFSIAAVTGETYINIYGRDITDRKRAEEAVRASEQRFALVTEAATEGIYEWNIETDELYVSDPGKMWWLGRDDDLTASAWKRQIHPEDFEKYRKALIAHYKGVSDHLECEYRIRGQTGQHRWVLDRGKCVHNEAGRAVRMIGAVSDITERKRAERELAEKEAQLRVALDNMPSGILFGDRDLNNVLFNWRYWKMHGYADGVLVVGANIRDELRYQVERGDFGPGDTDDLIEQTVALYQTGEIVRSERKIAGSGRTLLLDSARTPDGGYVTIVTDITERKQAVADLRAAKDEAEKANRAKSQFLANMSHELRTPLNAILGYIELIQDSIYGEVPEKVRKVIGRIDHNGRHLLNQINDVLDLSKIEAGELKLSLNDYSMQDIVDGVISNAGSLAAVKNLTLNAIVPPDLPTGLGDDRRISQVLLNLVGNAIKFTSQGEVSVRVSASNGQFQVAVADTGIGISEADRAEILNEFYQADSSSTRAHGGTGLGLAITKRMVELHGGRLWIESTLGEGSTFSFSLPVRVEQNDVKPGE